MRKTALITGAARRVGAVMAEYLHAAGYCVMIHCHRSILEAEILAKKLNAKRPDSAKIYSADLRKMENLKPLIQSVIEAWGQLDVLINNASVFYPTELASASESSWDELMHCNAKVPFFLSQAAYHDLKKTRGHIINITDFHAERTFKKYGIYSMSKSLLLHQTKCLAREWGEHIRVNAVAPGSVIWPEGDNTLSVEIKQEILAKTALKKQVSPLSIAKAVMFLLDNEDITGDVIHVSAGRGL